MQKIIRFQGSLEYLIILAAVIAIASVVVLMLSNSTSSTTSNFDVSACKQAASECAFAKKINSLDSCFTCDESCVSDNLDVVTKVTASRTSGGWACCLNGNSSEIYQGASGCVLS